MGDVTGQPKVNKSTPERPSVPERKWLNNAAIKTFCRPPLSSRTRKRAQAQHAGMTRETPSLLAHDKQRARTVATESENRRESPLHAKSPSQPHKQLHRTHDATARAVNQAKKADPNSGSMEGHQPLAPHTRRHSRCPVRRVGELRQVASAGGMTAITVRRTP